MTCNVLYRNFAIGIIAFSFLLSPTLLLAQQYPEIYLLNGEHIKIDNPNFTSVTEENGEILAVQNENPNKVVRIIVIFKDQPLSVFNTKNQNTSLTSAFSSLQTSHTSFRTKLNSIQSQLSAQYKSDYNYIIKHDYYRALNGVALECKQGMIDKIRALPMVQQVNMDTEVKAHISHSVHQIRADIVQDSLGYTGSGVLVGIIDTGIDYENPALGGGFGPDFRVIGGYDFENNDNDPMDDNGHGTHVAGIVGASSADTIRGVAPGVHFLAIKVLDAKGSGLISQTIAGIEYCLDPDNNPETDDAVDIISMSLGSTATYDNPQDIAVNNATKSGILTVVSAGNKGYGKYRTIGSPGTSKTALTVGACDSTNSVTFFSSLGPDPVNYSIKPEVLAPGVDILSTVLSNKMGRKSGTSMAAPHVAGVAALLKEQHPTWTGQEIKAAIVNSAHLKEEGVSIFAQGKGYIDALDAVQLKMMVEPGIISFGMVDLANDVWIDTVKLTIRNFHSSVQNLQIRVVDELPGGVTLTFDKTSFSLSPQGETTIEAILNVSSAVPLMTEEPFAYVGMIEAISESDNIFVPFSFTKASILIVEFDTQPVRVTFYDQKKSKMEKLWLIQEGTKKFSFNVEPGGELDVAAIMKHDTLGFSNYYLVDHKINNQIGLSYAFVSRKEATIPLFNTIYDLNNNPVLIDSSAYFNLNFIKPFGQIWLNWFLGFQMFENWQFFSSSLDSSIFIEKQITAIQDSDAFVLKKSSRGLKNSLDISIDSGIDNIVRYYIEGSYVDSFVENPSELTTGFFIGYNVSEFSSVHQVASIKKIFFNKQYVTDESQSTLWLGIGYKPSSPHGSLRTANFSINEKGEALFKQEPISLLPWGAGEKFYPYNFELKIPGDTIKIQQNASIAIPDFLTYMHSKILFLKNKNDWNDFADSFGGIKQTNGVSEYRGLSNAYWNIPLFNVHAFAHNKVQTNKKPFSTWQQDQILNSYDYFYAMYTYEGIQNITGTFRLLCDSYPYTILGQTGRTIVDFEYRIPGNINNTIAFPSFNLLQVLGNGRATDIIQPGQIGMIRLVPFDPYNSITSVQISLLMDSGDEVVLPIEKTAGGEYTSPIPDDIPHGFIDVVARIKDKNGNEGELIAGPAFYSGYSTDKIHLDARLHLISYTLNNVNDITMQSGDTLNYMLSYINYGSEIARNVQVTFPTTSYVRPVKLMPRIIDSLKVNDIANVSVKLIFLGNQESIEKQTHYLPVVAWDSGEKRFQRKHKVLIDFQNQITDITLRESILPDKFELYQNYPNPFNASTEIHYDLPRKSKLKLEVYDILGRKVATLADETKGAGRYKIIWNADQLASGVYFYRLLTKDYSTIKKLLFLK